MRATFKRQTTASAVWPLRFVAASVLLSGFLVIASILFSQSHYPQVPLVGTDTQLTLLTGLTFIYLAGLLRRGKRSAWLVALPVYGYIVVRNIRHFVFDLPNTPMRLLPLILNLLVPVLALTALIVYRHLFTVRSEVRNSAIAARRALLILLVAFFYGVIGFQLMDQHDFHREISVTASAHYVVDQFGLTTETQATPYTHRAKLFLDSLGYVGLGALFYVAASFFSPIRFRLSSQEHDYEEMRQLLNKHPASSEDFFKLWPKDKAYYFNSSRSAGLAYRTIRGTALCVGGPAGQHDSFRNLIENFGEYCRTNDWEPAFIHTESTPAIYKDAGFENQKIGEEAVVDIAHFNSKLRPNKYFRHINRKFEEHRYSCEVLKPPHSKDTLKRLEEISNDWLAVPGRSERGFMLGYYSSEYMQQCPVVVARNDSSTIQAFLNILPVFDPAEANFDLLRHSRNSPGNINDFLLMYCIDYLNEQGYKRLNLGLCPLSGLDGNEQNSGALSNVLRFVYANGNRFYSFQGLRRFKAKYEPKWRSRYIIYKGGLPGFSRTLNALLKAMRHRQLHLH